MCRLLVLFFVLCTAPSFASVVDRIAAVVNGHVITEGEVSDYLLSHQEMPGFAGLDSTAALNALIEQVLADAEAERLGVRPSDAEVDEALVDIRERNQLSEAEFRAALESQGMDFQVYLQELRDQLLRVKVTNRVLRDSLSVSDENLREYYLKNVAEYCETPSLKLLHLELGEQGGQARAEAVREAVQEKGGFAEAGEPLRGDRLRDLGYVLLDNLSSDLKAVLAGLAPGQVSPVVELKGSCHLFYVADRQEGRIRPFEEVREEIRARYIQDQEQELFRTWLDSLREKARIDRMLNG